MEANTVAGALGTIVAERTFAQDDGTSKVRVVIGKPRKDRASGDFFCPYRIEGFGKEEVQQAWGIDSVQALLCAVQAIRARLEPHAEALEWLGGRGGSLGFPKMVPDLFGPKLSRRLDKMLERETNRHARTLERSGRAKQASQRRRR